MRLGCLLFLIVLALPRIGSAQQSAGDTDIQAIDTAIRSGDLKSAWDQVTRRLIDAHVNRDLQSQLALLDRGMQICLMMDYPYLADRLYMRAKDLGMLRDSGRRIHGFLMKARIQFSFGNFKQMQLLLEKASNFVDADTTQADLSMLFAQRALHAWLTHQHSAANKYIEAVLFDADDEEAAGAKAVALLVLALMIDDQAVDSSLIASNLELSRQQFQEAGQIVAFYAMLGRILALHPGRAIRSIDSQFLEYVVSGKRYANPWITSMAINAESELQRREGNYQDALDLLQQANAFEQLTKEESENLELEWRLLTNAMHTVPPRVENPQFPLQWVILTMLLVLLMLILLLRIHTQRMINEKLIESVEKSRIAEQAAEHANRLKSQFVSNVSHEIKTPMNGLVGMASLLEELVEDPLQRKYLGTIRQCSNNLLILMNDLLDLGRIDANKLEIDRHPFDAREIISYCENIVELRAGEKGLSLTVQVDASVPQILIGDSTRLSQILVNLLNNAIKFTDVGSVSMMVGFEKSIVHSGDLVVVVEDTGRGIEPDRLPTVFEPFNQPTTQEQADGYGSGLGLAICKRLTDHMGGTLQVHSEFGKGSRFTLSLPVAVPHS